MFNLFAHAGHSCMETMNSMAGNDFDHCMPVVIGAGIIIAILIGVIIYLLTAWRPKKHPVSDKVVKARTKKK